MPCGPSCASKDSVLIPQMLRRLKRCMQKSRVVLPGKRGGGVSVGGCGRRRDNDLVTSRWMSIHGLLVNQDHGPCATADDNCRGMKEILTFGLSWAAAGSQNAFPNKRAKDFSRNVWIGTVIPSSIPGKPFLELYPVPWKIVLKLHLPRSSSMARS